MIIIMDPGNELKNWKKTAESTRGKVYLVFLWITSPDEVKAKMPEEFQLKMLRFLDGWTGVHRALVATFHANKEEEWTEDTKFMWDNASTQWPRKQGSLPPPNTYGESFPTKCMWCSLLFDHLDSRTLLIPVVSCLYTHLLPGRYRT